MSRHREVPNSINESVVVPHLPRPIWGDFNPQSLGSGVSVVPSSMVVVLFAADLNQMKEAVSKVIESAPGALNFNPAITQPKLISVDPMFKGEATDAQDLLHTSVAEDSSSDQGGRGEDAAGLGAQASRRGAPRTRKVEEMTHPTRDEIDAKLSAVEARIDGRVSEAVGKIETLLVKIDERDKLHQVQMTNLNARVVEQIASARSSTSTIVTTVIGTGGVVAGLIFAALSAMTGSFDSGRDTAQLTGAAQKYAAAAQQSAVAAGKSAAVAKDLHDPVKEAVPAEASPASGDEARRGKTSPK
ncbi:hypothetical protein [Stenotrophomonas sp. CFBP 13725]|uniref:hypothetical protein n=1 Tax=Stenotrophomonas sp. CFBP 13725 TaxID=2775297 RepID=UPI0017859351|nr:hypothetical protein [Stenotrophomonas sp. CFBP 13725]MBD8635642.1 hypothetical protein [Stenotrophomonas sp. CFBP 13725]